MKKINALALAMLFASGVMAEVSLPYGIAPVNGEIRLLYRPGFESTCILKNESDLKDVPTEAVTKLFLDSLGRMKFEMKMDKFSVTADINHDGSAITRGSLKFITEDQATNEGLSEIFKDLENLYITYSPVGKPLKQNSDLSASDICEMFPGGGRSNFFSTFKRKIYGVVQIHGRPSLILKSDIDTNCTLAKLGQVTISGYSWESFDLQSGLNSDGGGHMLLKMGSDSEVNMNTTTSCVISDTAQATSAPSGKSLETRLMELKALMEKGLISQKQYEQKRADILKAL